MTACEQQQRFLRELFKDASCRHSLPRPAAMSRVQEVEACLVSLESQFIKLKATEGSAVRFQKAETNIIEKIEKSRDIMMAFLQDTTDKDRAKLLEAFGGDCRRIAKYRSVLEAITLSDKYASDQRLSLCLNAVNLIEILLPEKNYGDELNAVQDTIIPFQNPATHGNEAPAEPPAPNLAPKGYLVAEEARLAAEREAAEARTAAKHQTAERKAAFWQEAVQREAAERQAAAQR